MEFTIEKYEELDSTNTLLLAQAAQGAREGKVITADFQLLGRGKPGNEWISPKGKNLLFSLLIRPHLDAHQAPMVTQIACRSVAHVLREHYKIACQFKRPNDLLAGGRKICGILVESSSRASGKMESMVIGIGLNVNADPEEQVPESTSMKHECGDNLDRDLLLLQILEQLKEDLTYCYDHTS